VILNLIKLFWDFTNDAMVFFEKCNQQLDGSKSNGFNQSNMGIYPTSMDMFHHNLIWTIDLVSG